jgi:DNA-binding transcriptional LysR family regulator
LFSQAALSQLLPRYPDVNVEIIVDYGLTDIVAARFDAGVRLGVEALRRATAQAQFSLQQPKQKSLDSRPG